MLNKFTNALMALVMALGFMASTAHDAEARRGRGIALGVAAGIIGLGIGASIAHSRPRYQSRYDEDSCYYGPRECQWVGRRCFENRWGEVVCRGGRHVCERPLICE